MFDGNHPNTVLLKHTTPKIIYH